MTEMITGARANIELPAPQPLGGGVLSVANVIDVTDPHQLMGVEATTDACATAEEWDEWCTMTPAARKVFEAGPEVVLGDPFAVYAGVECTLVPLEDQRQRARQRLTYGESRAVDYHVLQFLDTGGERNLGLTGLSVAGAIGSAEAYAATIYGGVPTILVPRHLLGCACDCASMLRANLDGTLTTAAGSRVAPITAPYPFVNNAIYVTGDITVLRGPVADFSVPQQIADDGSFSPARALAERLYVTVFDCLIAEIDATCGDTP